MHPAADRAVAAQALIAGVRRPEVTGAELPEPGTDPLVRKESEQRSGGSMTTTSSSPSTATGTAGAASSDSGKPFAVITGASSGIGLELAKQCAQHGFDVLIAADDSLAEAASTLHELGAEVQSVQTDLANADGVEELASAVTSSGRPVDVLCLNAGVGESGPFIRTKLEDDLRLISLNIVSAVHLAKRLVPAMVERGEGRILFTSSIASIA